MTRVQLRLRDLPAAAAARRATSSIRGCRARRRSSPTTGSCCSRPIFILFATMFPTLSEAVRGERLTVGPPFYNKWMLPIGLVLLLLTGIGPLLAWRKSTLANLRDQFLWPVLTSVVVSVALVVARRARVGLGPLLRAVGVHGRHHHAGVHPRRARAPGRDRHRHLHRAHRPLRALAPPLRAATSSTSASCSSSSASRVKASSRKSSSC